MKSTVLVVMLCACGVQPRPDLDDSLATLSIEPQNSEHWLVDGAVTGQRFSATATYPGGMTRDVTSETTFQIDTTFGLFSGADLSIMSVGKANAHASWGTKTADTSVTARLKHTRVAPGVSPNAPNLFTGLEVTDSLTIVYPPVGVTMPRNVDDFETHWTSTGGLDTFEVSLRSEYADIRVYVPGGNGLPAAGPNASWAALLPAEWSAGIQNEVEVTYQVRGVSSINPTMVHAAAPRRVDLSSVPMRGAVYYWAQKAGSVGIYRHDMTVPNAPVEEFMTTNQTGGRCVACHALSRDGSRMSVTYDGGPTGQATVVDVATKVAQPANKSWNFATFTPDATQMFTVSGFAITVRDPSTQAVITTMPSDGPATQADISPDGTKVVYIRPSVAYLDYMFGGGKIVTRSYDAATHEFGPEQLLVTDGANNYYPSWSPDGNWIVFNRSTDGGNGGAYSNPSAEVWIVKADGSVPAFPLATANLGPGLTNSWARWAPFKQTSGPNNEPLFWITVSSKRDFGTRFINTGRQENQKIPQLWMMAFYPDRVGAGDPSVAAFRLPFQDLLSDNHAAQWTEQLVNDPL